MPKPQTATNPFYPLLVLAGVAFAITACAYGVMTLKALSASPGSSDTHPLLVFLDRYGMWLMAAELALLALTSFLAMGTDSYWSANNQASADETSDDRSTLSDSPR